MQISNEDGVVSVTVATRAAAIGMSQGRRIPKRDRDGEVDAEARQFLLRPRQASEILSQLARGRAIKIFCLEAASRQGICLEVYITANLLLSMTGKVLNIGWQLMKSWHSVQWHLVDSLVSGWRCFVLPCINHFCFVRSLLLSCLIYKITLQLLVRCRFLLASYRLTLILTLSLAVSTKK